MLHRWGDPVQHLWLSGSRTAMDRSARLFLCPRCCEQVVLCSHCDHGQVYCSPSCSSAGRHEHRRHSAQRYQDSRGGRLKHAARTACWRRRQRCLRPASADADVNRVTHHGCASLQADASLPACETTNACEPIDLTGSASDIVPVSSATAALAAPRCRCCGCALLLHVRLGWLRGRGVAPGGRHDHCP